MGRMEGERRGSSMLYHTRLSEGWLVLHLMTMPLNVVTSYHPSHRALARACEHRPGSIGGNITEGITDGHCTGLDMLSPCSAALTNVVTLINAQSLRADLGTTECPVTYQFEGCLRNLLHLWHALGM